LNAQPWLYGITSKNDKAFQDLCVEIVGDKSVNLKMSKKWNAQCSICTRARTFQNCSPSRCTLHFDDVFTDNICLKSTEYRLLNGDLIPAKHMPCIS